MRDSATLAKYGLTPGQSLALFLDDTYHVYWDASPSEVISKIGDHYLSVWNKERRAKAQSLGITPAEALIICSIADEETLKDDEKGVITRLYLNRLKKGMKLQADPTVRYALNDFTIKRVTTPMLSTDSPYNTYRNAGLPPDQSAPQASRLLMPCLTVSLTITIICVPKRISPDIITLPPHIPNIRRMHAGIRINLMS